MKLFSILCAFWAISLSTYGQNTLNAIIKDSHSSKPLPGATVRLAALNKAAISNINGEVTIAGIPDGRYFVETSYLGYVTRLDSLIFPISANDPLVLSLEEAEREELEDVVISSTRSSRTIETAPTRVEVIAGEELDEKANMKPGDIRMVLNESTGIQTQQTSATSANASIRIQGLDGRYTQILKDGFPIFSGAASGLGLLQTPPLDLKQVEVIKGSASTLYGGGAIAGLVNLISKSPSDERELNFHLNGTSAGGLDLNGFYAESFGKAGLTVFAARNSNKAYAPGSAEFSAIPEFERYTFNPKLFLSLGDKTSLNVGLNSSFENRSGGNLSYIQDDEDASTHFFETNISDRFSSQLALTHKINDKSEFNVRNSLSYFKRKITIPDYLFNGTQYATFIEANYAVRNRSTEWVAGLNLWTDHFEESQPQNVPFRNYRQTTAGAFVQNNIHATEWLELETGLRGDYVADYGFALLPRVSALVKFSEKLNSRIGGGFGYKTPTIFTEESERIQYQNVLPVSSEVNKLERSYGLNLDVSYRTPLFNNQVAFSVNHLFFYTYLNNPLTMELADANQYRFSNIGGHIDTRGMETNVKLAYQDFKLFVGYSLTDTEIHSGGVRRENPLTAKHRLNNVLMYEIEEKWKLGAEAYYYDSQRLNDNTRGKSYWIFGFMAEKLWDNFSIYINFENFSDTRQTRFDTIYTGTVSNPEFRDIYAPLDGFVVNGGLKLRL